MSSKDSSYVIPFDFTDMNYAQYPRSSYFKFKAGSMSTAINLLLAVMACTVICTTAVAASKRPVDLWGYYHFDGAGFKAGPSADGSAFIAVRERVKPVILMNQRSDIEPISLPDDSGVIAGICYFQSSGGKLGSTASYVACPRTALLISSGGKPFFTVQTDENGYFVTVLPAGNYAIGSEPFTAEISVDRGITSLVPLRAGKRMVD